MILSIFWGWWILIVCNCFSGTWDPPLWVVIFPSRGFFEVRSSERHLPGKLQLLGHLWMSVSARAASCPEGPGWFHNIQVGLTIRSMNLKIDTFLKLPYLKGNIVPVPDLFGVYSVCMFDLWTICNRFHLPCFQLRPDSTLQRRMGSVALLAFD